MFRVLDNLNGLFQSILISESQQESHARGEPTSSNRSHPTTWQGMNASVSVTQKGVTYNIGKSANVEIHNGPKIITQSSAILGSVLLSMERAKDAQYDVTLNVTRGPCTPDTRTAVLQKLEKWVISGTTRLYWLSGSAGTGKTTISYSFCDREKTAGRLGASFFCSRSLKDCRDLRLIIPTLSYQLAAQFPSFKDALVQVLESDPDISRKNLQSQLTGLIINPWRTIADSLPNNVVVVLDALDECEGDQTSFLQTLFDNIARLPFKILITSRPDYSVQNAFKSKDSNILATFILHDVEKDLVEADIARYVQDKLSDRVPEDVLDELRRLAGSLFIYAATLVRFFAEGNIDPRRRLKLLNTSLPAQTKAMTPLDQFYQAVLVSALQEDKLLDEEVEDFKELLFTVVCAQDPLTRDGLSEILDVPRQEVDRLLDSLHSVLSIPSCPDHPVVILHASFADFIQKFERSGRFCCHHEESYHIRFTERCFRVLNSQLYQNLCGLAGRLPNSSIDSNTIQSSISPALQYATVHWPTHWMLCATSLPERLTEPLRELMTKHALHWFECLSLLSKLAVTIQRLEDVEGTLNEDIVPSDLIYESRRFLQQSYERIEYSASEVYHSALTWIPTQSPLRTYYSALCQAAPSVLCGLSTQWPRLERAISIHSDDIWTVSLSQDGSRLASGSSDKTVSIWSTRNQTEECTLVGHTKRVRFVAITLDGSHVVSGSWDRTIRVWNIATQKTVLTLEVPKLSAMALSSEGKLIASGEEDGRVCIWDALSGQLIHLLPGHQNHICTLCFTPNTTSLISGSIDGTACFSNVQKGEVQSVIRIDWSVRFAACSPVGDRIILGDYYKFGLFNISGEELRRFHHYRDPLSAVAFILGGNEIVTGSSGGKLLLWNITSGNSAQIFGSAGPIRSLAVFPNGLKIATCSRRTIDIYSIKGAGSSKGGEPRNIAETEFVALSWDGQRALFLPSMRILDTTTLEEKAILPTKTIEYHHGLWSKSGHRIVAASNKSELCVWNLRGDTVLGNPVNFQGRMGPVSSLSLSHDGYQLVLTSNDETARVWNIETGQQVKALVHDVDPTFSSTQCVLHAAFSHDDTHIVSCFFDSRTRIYAWDALSGNKLYQFDAEAFHAFFSRDNQHIITSYFGNITIFSSEARTLKQQYKGYDFWTTLDDDTSYVLSRDNWVCRIDRLGGEPSRLFWIPFQYRPNLDGSRISGPLFTVCFQGTRVCLPNKDGLVTFIIPRSWM